MYELQRRGWLCAVMIVALISDRAQSQQANPSADEGLYMAPADGGVRRWQLATEKPVKIMDAPGGTKTLGTLEPDHGILLNFGCLDTAGTFWCEVRSLHGGVRGFVPAAQLQPVEGPDGLIARGKNDSPRRAKRKRFDATAEIQCAQEQGQALGPCEFGVARSIGGDATAAVTFANGFTRYLFFMHGEFISASATMSGAGRDTDWLLESGVHYIRADDQQFRIPNEVLFGSE